MSDGDVPVLSAHTLAILQEFYNETNNDHIVQLSHTFAVGEVEEDWQMSQFWYSDETATRLAEEVIREAGEGGRIACVSAPTVYQKLKQGVVAGSDRVSAVVLEYDRRFAIYGDDFIFYDYNEPLSLEAEVAPQSFDVVLADPPYLSEECLSKVAKIIKYLSKGKVLLCTDNWVRASPKLHVFLEMFPACRGAVMKNLAKDLLEVKICNFQPKHNRNLSNEFCCYVNYPSRLLFC